VRPLANDIALMDATRHFQKHNINTLDAEKNELVNAIKRIEKYGDKALNEDSYK